jgi:hypothetical protein
VNRNQPARARASRRRLAALLVVGGLSAAGFAGIACTSLHAIAVPPVDPEASRLLVEAEALDSLDARGPDAAELRDRARALAERSAAAAPDWIAPRRLLDDLLRGDLRGVEALDAHLRRIETGGEDAGELYLAGRLEGIDGEVRFARAAELDPDLSWSRHGLAISAERRGDYRTAAAHARGAVARARDPWERSFFASSLARILGRAGKREEAAGVLERRLEDPDVFPTDARSLGAQLAEFGLESRDPAARFAAFRRGVDLLSESDLPDGEVETLAETLRAAAGHEAGDLVEISNALAAKRTAVRDRLRAEVLLASSSTPLALGLLERSLPGEGNPEVPAPLMRAARFAAGEFGTAVASWLADLPACVIGADGLPKDEALARVVTLARSLADAPMDAAHAAAWFEFGDALMAAGWFREARALAGALARADFERALALETRAGSGVALLEALDDLIRGADPEALPRLEGTRAERDGEGAAAGGRPPARKKTGPRDLSDLLADAGPIFARAKGLLGGGDPAAIAQEIAASPRISYGVAGEIVHPGPTFSAADERDGLGRAGDPVPGLARAVRAIHRFALVGELSGAGGADGTVLATLLTEHRGGAHLGVAWSGTVAWCEGADVKSRETRRGARISAAALHEGYWLDVDSVRGERAQFAGLAAQFAGPDASARIARALEVSGFLLRSGDDEERAQRERTRIGAVLGEASRVRLAILLDRRAGSGGGPGGAPEAGPLGRLTLDELVAVTATHEEGHLTDRTRFLPLSKHWGAVIGFLFDCGFSPVRIAETLEYRAELVAIAESDDPRISLAQTLDAAEAGGRGPTAHAGGYQELLRDLLGVLDDKLARDPQTFPAIDRSRTLVHQLHRLSPAEVRALALALAAKRGMSH